MVFLAGSGLLRFYLEHFHYFIYVQDQDIQCLSVFRCPDEEYINIVIAEIAYMKKINTHPINIDVSRFNMEMKCSLINVKPILGDIL